MRKRSRLALVLGGLVLAMAIVLRIRWQYDPPVTNGNYYLFDVLQAGIVERFAPPAEISDGTSVDIATISAASQAITVTPDDQNQLSYVLPSTTALVTGVQPNVLAIPSGYVVGFLFADRYVLKQYDKNWQPQPDDITIASNMQLINGRLPLTKLGYTGSEFVFVYTDQIGDDTIGVFIKRFTDLTAAPQTAALMVNLSAEAYVQADITSSGMAILVSESTTASRLLTFNAAGQLLAEVPLDRFGAARSVVGDNEFWLVFGQTEQGLYIEKFSALGSLQQAVSVNLPVAASAAATLVDVVRSGKYIALLFSNFGVVLADNLSVIYGRFNIASDQLYPNIMFTDEQLYFTYNTALTLTDYQIQTTNWPLATTSKDY